MRASFCVTALLLTSSLSLQASDSAMKYIESDRTGGFSSAVVVDDKCSLVHTSQLYPLRNGKIVGDTTAGQAIEVLDLLESVLNQANSSIDRVVKLNAIVIEESVVGELKAAFIKKFGPHKTPALSFVVGELARPGAQLAIDVVSISTLMPETARNQRTVLADHEDQSLGATFSILPAGPRIYISGQADPGTDLAAATRKTLLGLDATLRHLGQTREDVVQVKAFLAPMSSSKVAEKEICQMFGVIPPPLVFVEWKMTQPIEIELILAGKPNETKETVEYLATPELKASPVFSRVARVNRGDLVYVSSLFGPEGASGPVQVEMIFENLKRIVGSAGSDLNHLVKATYYVSDEASSKALNDIRPKYYDKLRPPAASKATVTAAGLSGRTVNLDMIAVVPVTTKNEP